MNTSKGTILVSFTAIMLAASAPFAVGATTVGGFISTDTHWTSPEGPYVVQESIAVIGGATLTIDPGVEVRFDPDLALVVDSGTLVARGTEASPIRFTANQGSGNRWAYLQLSDGASNAVFDGANYLSGSILEHTIVEYAGSLSAQGAVRAIDSSPFIGASAVRDNTRGGIYVEGAGANGIRLEENTISSNTGRGVYVHYAQSVQLNGNSISGSTGGGVYLNYANSATLTGNTISGNTGSSYGGGAYLGGSSGCTLTNNTISGNTASSYGGGAYLNNADSATLTGNTISGNTASVNGGGAYLTQSSGCTLTSNTIMDNTASDRGGGAYLEDSSGCTLTSNTITDNTAANHGGAIYVRYSDDVSLSQDRITGNHSDLVNGAGGIFLTEGTDRWDLTGPDDPDNPALCVHLFGNDGYQFYNNNAFGGSFGYTDAGNVDARYVYWGTTDPAAIEAGIYDFFDDASRGVVFYDPCAIPEPATLSLLALGGLALIRRRRI